MDIPGPSTSASAKEEEQEFNNKLLLKSALKISEKLLVENEYIPEKSVKDLSTEKTTVIGHEIYNRIVDMVNDMHLVEEEELVFSHEKDIDDSFIDCASMYPLEESLSSQSSPLSEEWIDSPEKKKFKTIDLDYKRKVVAIAKEHPNWSLQTLQREGAHYLKCKSDLKQWEKDVLSGGTRFDKLYAINSWTLDRFTEAREKFEQVTTRTLQQWAMAAAQQFLSSTFKFSAGKTWADDFKRRNNIRERRITKYVSEKEAAGMDEILAVADRFRKQIQPLLQNYSPDLIINTDQTGCQYQSTINWTLAQKDVKSVFVKKKSLHKISHSYTAQYALTCSGKLVPKVFLCLQETGDKFGPIIQKQVDALVVEFVGNVIVKCSKSGKLTTNIYKDFLKEILQPYVKNEKFLLIIDSWGGQTNSQIYDDIFVDDEDIPSCQIKIIPPKCTLLCQPCDVYFFRQVQNFIKKLQNCTYLLKRNRKIANREDAIKIHSLVHNQLSAPIFCDMLKYAWFASQITNERTFFKNVNEVCFPDSVNKTNCTDCAHEMSMIVCAWCNELLCFKCFYDKYHPKSCKLIVKQ
ncbi:uncharacterized protein LOC116845214 [Odontomachus brunneus]|uniref:uncharacterized protein LOC116845214 n=1 Tax=Odontomachus brunneus TaxID=486640 RepID=UPI0013F1D473|nr:uncharacterized protein LOC116845214 [Odontomachus brunneus]